MRIAILNWSDGENDPFSFFNQQFRQQLVDLGHDVIIVPLNAALGTTMQAIQGSAPVDFVLTWQGLGSARPNATTSQTLWAQLELPVVCLHGDHPCYNPPNHQPSSHHLLHVYPVAAFARDANRLIPREWPALFEPLPKEEAFLFSFFCKNFFYVTFEIRSLSDFSNIYFTIDSQPS